MRIALAVNQGSFCQNYHIEFGLTGKSNSKNKKMSPDN
jgi:hypothetical protein